MSYSFSVAGKTKAEVKEAAAKEFDNVVKYQANHAYDRAAALANIDALIDLLPDEVPEGHVLKVNASGYLSWQGTVEDPQYTGASTSANAHYVLEKFA